MIPDEPCLATARPGDRADAARHALTAALLAWLATGACDPGTHTEEAGPTGFSVRDSGDVEIVENHAPEWPTGRFWTIDPEPEFVLGGNTAPHGEAGDSSHLIWQVAGLARLTDGRIAVLSAGNDQLLLFEPSGVLSMTIGRRGRGPGEFERAARLQYLSPDTLVVWQSWMGAVSYFDTDGVLLNSRPLDLGRIMGNKTGANAESWTYPLPDGSFMLQADRPDPGLRPCSGRSDPLSADRVLSHRPRIRRPVLRGLEGTGVVAFAQRPGVRWLPHFRRRNPVRHGGSFPVGVRQRRGQQRDSPVLPRRDPRPDHSAHR